MRAAPYRDIILSWLSQTAAGALTWAQTLSSGNLSGGSDPTISAGDRILFDGVREQPSATFALDESIATAPALDITGANFVGASPNLSTSIRVYTGDASAAAPGAGAASGLVQVFTGASTDGAGTAGPTGNVQINTGPVTSASGSQASGTLLCGTGNVSGGSRRSGNFRVLTGSSTTSGRTGDLDLDTGENTGTGDSGYVFVNTGNTGAGDSGYMAFTTGDSTSGTSGDITLQVGNGSALGGSIGLAAGQATAGSGGSVTISGGVGNAGTGGDINLASAAGTAGAGSLRLGLSFASVTDQAMDVGGRYTQWDTDGFQTVASRSLWQKKITCQVAPVVTTAQDDPDFELQTNVGLPGVVSSTTNGLLQIQAGVGAGEYRVVRPESLISSWGKAVLARATRYTVGGTVIPSAINGRYEVGARPTTNAFDNTTDDNKTILFFDPGVSPNWQAVTSNAGVDTIDDTGIPAAPGVPMNYRIVINTSNQAEYWLTNPARGNRLELVAVRAVGIGLAGNIHYAGSINQGAQATMEWGNPIQAANL